MRGNAIVAGDVQVVLIDSDAQGSLMVIVTGTARSQNRGRITRCSFIVLQLTQFRGTKRIFMTPNGVTFEPVRVSATTNSHTTGISTSLPGLRDRIARRIASRRVENPVRRPEFPPSTIDNACAADIDKQVEESLSAPTAFLRAASRAMRAGVWAERNENDVLQLRQLFGIRVSWRRCEGQRPGVRRSSLRNRTWKSCSTPSLTHFAAIGPGNRMMLTNLFNAILDDLLERRAAS